MLDFRPFAPDFTNSWDVSRTLSRFQPSLRSGEKKLKAKNNFSPVIFTLRSLFPSFSLGLSSSLRAALPQQSVQSGKPWRHLTAIRPF
jgi:hypothetical protein